MLPAREHSARDRRRGAVSRASTVDAASGRTASSASPPALPSCSAQTAPTPPSHGPSLLRLAPGIAVAAALVYDVVCAWLSTFRIAEDCSPGDVGDRREHSAGAREDEHAAAVRSNAIYLFYFLFLYYFSRCGQCPSPESIRLFLPSSASDRLAARRPRNRKARIVA